MATPFCMQTIGVDDGATGRERGQRAFGVLALHREHHDIAGAELDLVRGVDDVDRQRDLPSGDLTRRPDARMAS